MINSNFPSRILRFIYQRTLICYDRFFPIFKCISGTEKNINLKENTTYLFYFVAYKIFTFAFRVDKNHAKSKLLVSAVCHKNKN